MPRKKVDARVRTLIENGVKTGHRSLFVIVGDRGKECVVNLHYMLTKARVKAQPNVLWCYKKELGFSTYVQAMFPIDLCIFYVKSGQSWQCCGSVGRNVRDRPWHHTNRLPSRSAGIARSASSK